MGVKQILSQIVVASRRSVGLRGRGNRVAPVLSSKWERELGVGQSWTPLSYGEYYPRSAAVYTAIKVRQDAIIRVPLKVYQRVPRPPATLGEGPAAVEQSSRTDMPVPGRRQGIAASWGSSAGNPSAARGLGTTHRGAREPLNNPSYAGLN